MADEITGARIDGIDPDSGEAYTVRAGESYRTAGGTLIHSNPFAEEPSDSGTESGTTSGTAKKRGK